MVYVPNIILYIGLCIAVIPLLPIVLFRKEFSLFVTVSYERHSPNQGLSSQGASSQRRNPK